MGRGDSKSKKGKVFKGSFGNVRPKGKKVLKKRAAKVAPKKTGTTTAKKPAAKK